MPDNEEDISLLAGGFQNCRNVLRALGDETWQHLILEMIQSKDCGGARVAAITERSHLSRASVSHHLKILKEAGIVKMRREGRTNYYYFDADAQAMNGLLQMLAHAKAITERLPDRSARDG